MTKGYLSISNILITHFKPRLLTTSHIEDLPQSIQDWKLDQKLKVSNNFSTGVYINNEGKKGFVKFWSGRFKDANYYRLKNELFLYTVLNKYATENKSEITTPKLLKEIEEDNSLIGILEYVEGEKVSALNTESQVTTYAKTLDFLKSATEYVLKSNHAIPKRSTIDNIKLFPFYLILRAFWHPLQLISILKLSVFYVLNISTGIKSTKLYLAHRDLHLDNIMVSRGFTYIIDLEYMALSTQFSDLASTLRLEYIRHNEFVTKLMEFYPDQINSKFFLVRCVEVLFKWGVEDGFSPRQRTYHFMDYIKRRIKQDAIISLRSRLYSTLTRKSRNSSILCYHGIDGTSTYSVTYTEFIKQIAALKQHYDFISLKEVLEGKEGIALTFDDGFASVTKVTNYLKSNDIPYALFVLTDPDNANRQELDSDEILLTQDELITLAKDPLVTIGCHSATHANLTSLNDEDLEHEIIASKAKLQKLIGKKIDFFAYPKGVYSKEIITKVRQAGYTAAFTVLPGTFNVLQNDLLIPRTVVNNSHTAHEMCALISPATQFLKKVILRSNLYGYLNYEQG